MPGNETNMTTVPDDVRNLKDFPCYDESFQDGPRFRQNLSSWAGKTEKARWLSVLFTDSTIDYNSYHNIHHFQNIIIYIII